MVSDDSKWVSSQVLYTNGGIV
ncbi:hypothetical protein [Dokdonia sp. Dokd-P16]|nr:hypothetical protein [Dokdonia sp. Dokd-P16]